MSAPAQVQPVPQPSIFAMYRALVGVGILCGLLIVSVYEATKPIIAKNRAEALQRAVFNVIPGADSSQTFLRTESGFELLGEDNAKQVGDRVYAGYGKSGDLVGVALEARGMGYADVITVLYGYSFEEDAIVGMKVLESKETPGLGDKIEKDPSFVSNFEALDVSLSQDGSTIQNPIVAVPSGEKTEPWQVDSITGATISSKAIAKMLKESSARWVPILEKAQAQLEKKGASDE